MFTRALVAAATASAMGLGSVVVVEHAHADGMFSMMNPFEWFFDDDDDDWWYRRYGPWGGYGPYGYGPYGYGWGGGPWGYGHPGYGQSRTVIVLPEQKSASAPEPVYPE